VHGTVVERMKSQREVSKGTVTLPASQERPARVPGANAGRSGRNSARVSALRKLKIAVVKIGTNGTRDGFKLADRLMQTIPGLREA